VSLTDRDRKIVIALVPLLIVGAFWFLLLAPKREEASTAAEQVAAQQELRDAAVAQAAQLQTTKSDFGAEYAALVRLGKAIPTSVDMPSLIVQLNAAARGAGIEFDRISTGARVPAASTDASSTDPGGAPASTDPVDAGGSTAQSGPGQAVESANDAAAASDTKTSTTASDGGLPIGGGSVPPPIVPGQPVPGLDTVPLELQFSGGFFELADFFHRLKRFVRVANRGVAVHGRLLTVDALKFAPNTEPLGGALVAEVDATIYLAPDAAADLVPSGALAPGTPATASDDGATGPPTATVTP
jgi:Tfp pilus assembly protein PilO